jgi:hypothetical protein
MSARAEPLQWRARVHSLGDTLTHVLWILTSSIFTPPEI